MADAGYLTIGKVVKRLQSQYPDLSVSKVRYLEDEGLLTPSRTPGGYRLYSSRDVKRLETILYLQKNRFLPLSVIKEELDGAGGGSASLDAFPQAAVDDEETLEKMHPLEDMPELLGVSVGFVRDLANIGVVKLHRSPRGHEMVDGHEFRLIRTCDALSRYGIEPRNLRQYVNAANRESSMFQQALSTMGPRRGEFTDEQRAQYDAAFEQLLALTDDVRNHLIKRAFREGGS
ncbi:MerR family transcriptional regulator [Olsenella sp. YH-ols2217]|uniref:MerR family transcriptional regulator n=1 Tax=Kribbibacterium absianum TaxID=3044210 RepID=A0ABT6ZIU2_9ACTN|nr:MULTISPECIES: MerR family transcriptional regulator [unclassified Olsenella]MDJ1121464.1 MerR family transcriptional regulator [Olsenella sp. YH-ols2216]MDJ1128954.1 MerR family transcriptional regulator [Olsenella sp. YH-ols2217]